MAIPLNPSPFGSIGVAPPNVGPEPAGLAAAVSQLFSGKAASKPDPYSLTDQQLIDSLADTRKLCEPGRELFEYGWWRCLLYDLGRQWIYWNSTSRQWNDKRLAKWVPKPVTNKVRETRMAIQALLADITPGISTRPNGRGPKNITAAETVDDIAPLIHDEHDMDTNLWDADYWAVMLGNAFLHPHWDTGEGTKTAVQLDQCGMCNGVFSPEEIVQNHQRCPNCNSTALSPAMNPDGSPATELAMIGRGQTLICSPLELLLPLHAAKFEKVDRLIHLAWEPRHVVEDLIEDEGDGSIKTDRLQWTSGPQYRSMQLYRSLASMADLPFAPSAFSTGGTQGETTGATVQTHWIKPCRKYPQGFYMKFIGDGQPVPLRTQQTGAIPVQDKDGNALWPWIHYPYSRVGGRLYGQGAIDIIIQKQDQVNQHDSMTALSKQRMGNPIWLEPKGAEVERFTGEPGLVVKYQVVGANSAKPERLAGEPQMQSDFALREQHIKDIEDLSGTHDVVKGAKPSGVEAFSALQLLVERSQSRFTPTFKLRGHAYKEWFAIAVELERNHGPETRVRASLSPNNRWTFADFKKIDLHGDIAIIVEDGSNVPKTVLGQRAAIEHARQLGFIDPQSPDQQYAIFQKLGTLYLMPSLDADIKSCLQEQAAWEQWFDAGLAGPPPLVRQPWHNDQVHLAENRRWMNSDDVRERIERLEKQTPGAGAIVTQMLAGHLLIHAEQLTPPPGAEGPAGPSGTGGGAGASAGSPSSPPGGRTSAPGGGRAMENSAQESGKPGVGTPGKGAPQSMR